MTPYYVRVTDRSKAITALQLIGLLDADGNTINDRDCWVEIGPIFDEQAGDFVRAPDGTPYWHGNLLFRGDLTAHVQGQRNAARDAGDAERADELTQLLADAASYFPLDADGNPSKPNSPACVFAGVG